MRYTCNAKQEPVSYHTNKAYIFQACQDCVSQAPLSAVLVPNYAHKSISNNPRACCTKETQANKEAGPIFEDWVRGRNVRDFLGRLLLLPPRVIPCVGSPDASGPASQPNLVNFIYPPGHAYPCSSQSEVVSITGCPRQRRALHPASTFVCSI